MITKEQFCKMQDHSLLAQYSKREDVKKRCEDVVKYGFAAVVLFPCEVAYAKSIIGDKAAVSTVIGYPMGANTTKVKIFEALDALDNGATDLDVVMNISRFMDGDYDYVRNELTEFVDAVKAKDPNAIVKVIIEVFHLKDEKKLADACELVIASGADFVKQATGYSPEPNANNGIDNLRAIRRIVGDRIAIKNAGNPADLDECLQYIKECGVTRFGHNYMPAWLDQAGDDYWKDK